jgi:hypothetical protein
MAIKLELAAKIYPANWRQIGPNTLTFELGQKQKSRRNFVMSALTPKTDIEGDIANVGDVPCVDGSELARRIFTFAALVGAAMCSAFGCGSHDRWP